MQFFFMNWSFEYKGQSYQYANGPRDYQHSQHILKLKVDLFWVKAILVLFELSTRIHYTNGQNIEESTSKTIASKNYPRCQTSLFWKEVPNAVYRSHVSESLCKNKRQSVQYEENSPLFCKSCCV